MQLSLRLSAIFSLVPFEAAVCDVGTDHGYLAIELIKSGRAKRVIATDIGEKPLANARKNIDAAKARGIELRLCDGLSGVTPDEVDTVIIAGMGGEVIAGIIQRGSNITGRRDNLLILQPTTSPEFLRRFLLNNGYEILSEIPIFENGKVYSVMKVCFTGNKREADEYFYYVGCVVPDTEAGFLYIKKQLGRCFECMNSLEGIASKQEDYIRYTRAYMGIRAYLNSFEGE